MADAQRCRQTNLDLLAVSRNTKEVASADGECEGADEQASAPTSCSLHFVGNLQRNAGGSHRGRISHPVARSLLRRPGARTLLPSEAGQRKNQQAATNGSDPLAIACAPAALAPDRSRGEALRRGQRQAGDLSQDGIQECRQARGAWSWNTLMPGLVDGHSHLSFLEKADIVENR